ncbi:hypothetical protein VFPBJ_11752 [Purpureocillium lilacinum]|uniref:Uncharacterized protein n=1 Tax=Purpureocillium lilacinum TaxID=33203 RepID=A0A179EW68_PURLI|nr:hypothetical protein VFPBJ_11752 [Purpureocillium lilacinum]
MAARQQSNVFWLSYKPGVDESVNDFMTFLDDVIGSKNGYLGSQRSRDSEDRFDLVVLLDNNAGRPSVSFDTTMDFLGVASLPELCSFNGGVGFDFGCDMNCGWDTVLNEDLDLTLYGNMSPVELDWEKEFADFERVL